MKTSAALVAVVLAIGCHNTWQGAKVDTQRAAQKTGHGIEKAGEKLEHSGDKK